MKMPLHEKLALIRVTEGLSGPEFAKRVGIPENTLKGIWKRGSSPKGDQLEKVAAAWPKYAYWLLTDKTDPPVHVSPLLEEERGPVWRVLDRIGVSGREQMSLACPVKPDWMSKVHFIFCKEQLWDYWALVELKPQTSGEHIPAVVFDPGMNFLCGNAGKIQLREFAGFLTDIGRDDLIKTAEMHWITPESRVIERQKSELAVTKAMVVDIGEKEELRKAHINFTAWRMQGESYEPKYHIDQL